MTFEADLKRLDALAESFGMPRCGCHTFLILSADDPEPQPCPLHGWAGSYILRLMFWNRREAGGLSCQTPGLRQ